jgi:hypothetical protein
MGWIIMFNILVTGANGQLGSEINEISQNYPYNFFFTDKETLDITDEGAIKSFVQENGINTIINCAAYTAVDKAESDEKNADQINRKAVKKLAKISSKIISNLFTSPQIMSLMGRLISHTVKRFKQIRNRSMAKPNSTVNLRCLKSIQQILSS